MKKRLRDALNMGLVLSGHHLVWGYKHGWLRWTPIAFRGWIVHIWNVTACFLFGHDTFDGTCTACLKEGLDRDN